jgi:enamine deaminase RidA (YjgF/YER057c/UK114 family)
MTDRQHVFSGSPYEPVLGYARALRLGSSVLVSGTTAPGADAASQAAEILRRIADALKQAGAELGDVVRTRVFLTDIADFDAVARAHGEVFGDIRPTTTFVAVAALADPTLRVEIEADAIMAEE